LLHGLAGAHDGHAADLALERQPLVRSPDGRRDGVLDRRQVVEPFLDQQADDAVGVEDKVPALRVFAADDAGGSGCQKVYMLLGGPRRKALTRAAR
jgi:hypothetical protein